jgi:lipoprotein-releasing system permease protein
MRLTFYIAVRFLLAKRRAMLMSLAGIVFGVAFFILTQAQTAGFERFFIQTILGINGAIRVQDRFHTDTTSLVANGKSEGSAPAGFEIPLKDGRVYTPGIDYPDALKEAVESFSAVTGVAEVVRGNGLAQSGFRQEEIRLMGIRLSDYLAVSELDQQLRYGSLNDFRINPTGVLMGTVLARRLQLNLGDTLLIKGRDESRRYKLSGIYETGVELYDKTFIYVHLSEARILLNQPTGATYLQVAITDPDKAPELADQMEAVLGHSVASWQDRERSWLEVFQVLRYSSAITMSTILFIAGLGMFNTLAIIVMERQREIAILRSMGYTRRDVSWIFIFQGLIVLVVGLILGGLFAAFLTWGVERLPIRIRGIFTVDHFVVYWSIWHYITAMSVASVMVLIASYIPARRAASFEPGTVIRGGSN